jgi:hypothetical protein
MVRRRVAGLAVLIVAVVVTQGESQFPYRGGVAMPRPVISPYLNLFRNGNTADFNYLTLVQPEINIRKNIGQLQQQQSNLQQTVQSGTYNEGELTTGHAFGFGTQKKYFNSLGGGAQSFRGTGPMANSVGQSRAPGSGASTSGSTKRSK